MPGGDAEVPEISIADPTKVFFHGFHSALPAVGTADLGPQRIRFLRIPRRNMNAIGHMAHRHLSLRPASEKRLEHFAAHFSMQTTDAVDGRAASYSKIGHIERFVPIVGILPPQAS